MIHLSDNAKIWLNVGQRGLSSEQIFEAMTGIPIMRTRKFGPHYPRDPADFARCQLLLEAVPEFADRLNEMRIVSKEWNALVDVWPEVLAMMDQEAPGWRRGEGSAPNAYKIMKKALE